MIRFFPRLSPKTGTLTLLLVGPLLAGLTGGCASDESISHTPARDAGTLAKPASRPVPLIGTSATLITHGLACPSCARGVQRELKELKGIRSFELDVVEDRIEVELDPAHPVTRQQIKDAVSWGGAILLDIRQP